MLPSCGNILQNWVERRRRRTKSSRPFRKKGARLIQLAGVGYDLLKRIQVHILGCDVLKHDSILFVCHFFAPELAAHLGNSYEALFSLIIVTGPPGCLKSGFSYNLLSKHLENRDEFGVYMTLEETTESHLRNMKSLGISIPDNLLISDYSDIRNLVFKEGDRVIANDVRNLIENLDELPFPDKDLFYNAIPYARSTYSIVTSRGCPYSCTYCFNNVYRRIYKNKGRYIRKRGVDSVIEELKSMRERYSCRFVAIHDEVFMTDDEWIAEFCEKYKETIGIPFRCIGHVNCINENNIRMLRDAGCEIIQIGVQTTCEHTRKNVIHRYETNDVIRRAARTVKEAKIRLEVDHILGFPREGDQEQVEAARFYNEIRPDIINCYWLKCFPKTDIIGPMIDDGRLSEEDIEDIEKGLQKSYILGGSVKDVRSLRKFSSLFSLIPVLPRRVIDTIIRRRLYRMTNFGNAFMAAIRVMKSLFWRDIRLLEFVSFYRRYMVRKIFCRD